LRGRIAELRRFPIKQDAGEVGWLADPEAQAQVAEVSLLNEWDEAVLMVDSVAASIGFGGADEVVE
jgi:hypothetical protein